MEHIFDTEIYTEDYSIVGCDGNRGRDVECYLKHNIYSRTKNIIFEKIEDIFVNLLFRKSSPNLYV